MHTGRLFLRQAILHKPVTRQASPSMLFFTKLTATFTTRTTPLHILVQTCKRANEVHEFLNKHDEKQVIAMARTTDMNGKIPLDLVDRPDLEYSHTSRIRELLINLLRRHKVKPLSEMLTVEEMVQSGYPPLNAELADNLTLACSAANAVRALIKYSSTHPDTNHLADSQRVQFSRMLKSFRRSSRKLNPDGLTSVYGKISLANCYEMSMIAVHFLSRQSTKPLYAYLVEIKNGDHVFVVFDKEPLTNANQYTVKETRATFCDPWGGYVGQFHQDELLLKMSDYSQYLLPGNKALNVVKSFNPAFHKFSIYKTFELPGCQEADISGQKKGIANPGT